MGEFFRPWRRKAGAVTLVLACAFLNIWFNSQSTKSFYCFGSGRAKTVHSLDTFPDGVMWQRMEFERPYHYRTGWNSRPLRLSEVTNPDEFIGPYHHFGWRRRILGFDFGMSEDNGEPFVDDMFEGRNPNEPQLMRMHFWLAPYWAIILLLVLLSAFLILSKPRMSKTSVNARVQPIPEK
jgi:hypothetical protein